MPTQVSYTASSATTSCLPPSQPVRGQGAFNSFWIPVPEVYQLCTKDLQQTCQVHICYICDEKYPLMDPDYAPHISSHLKDLRTASPSQCPACFLNLPNNQLLETHVRLPVLCIPWIFLQTLDIPWTFLQTLPSSSITCCPQVCTPDQTLVSLPEPSMCRGKLSLTYFFRKKRQEGIFFALIMLITPIGWSIL